MYIPKYDQGFKPAIIALREFNKKVEELIGSYEGFFFKKTIYKVVHEKS